MKKYLLLRDNRESGPFSIEELRDLKLAPKDLVWLEEESSCWLYPSEIEELKDFVSKEKKQPARIYVSRPGNIQPSYPSVKQYTRSHSEVASEEAPSMIRGDENKGIWKTRRLSSISNVASVAAVSCGLVLGAVMMKKAVEHSEKPMVAEEVPLTVIHESPAPVSPPVQNALLTETIPSKQVEANTPKPTKPKNIRDQIKIKASNYTVGVLGGISNLQLKVFNGSSQRLEKITLVVQYLKPNGSVIETDQYEMYSIKPLSAGTLAIPDSKRGVKIRYRIIDVNAKEIRQA